MLYGSSVPYELIFVLADMHEIINSISQCYFEYAISCSPTINRLVAGMSLSVWILNGAILSDITRKIIIALLFLS